MLETHSGVSLSVVIAAYNAEAFIEETLQSVLSQTYTNFELIIVDDGSIDSTYRIMNEITDEHSIDKQYGNKETGPVHQNVILIHTDNHGVAAARNAGMEHASGKWILFFDADDIMENDYLEKLMDAAIDEVDMVIGNTIKITEDGDTMYETSQEYNGLYETMNNPDALIAMADITATPGTKMFRKSILDGHGIKFIDVLAEDVAMYLEVLYFCRAVYVENNALIKYRITYRSMSKNVTEKELSILSLFPQVEEFLSKYDINESFPYAIENMKVKTYRVYGLHFTGTNDKKLRKDIFEKFYGEIVKVGEQHADVLCPQRLNDIKNIKRKLKRKFLYLNPLYVIYHRYKWKDNKEVL